MGEPPKIKKLEEAVINRIAAGEVIQRPVNAIKEMIENSIDAKSTNIQVTVKQGGLKYIQIQDNGSGIRREDFEIVCERFTTSKLREFEDLSTIATYGFRGEALASISHIAHLTIQSKTGNEKCAYRAAFVDGKLQESPKAVAGVQGTQIVVEDLFYNMNVRRAAMKNGAEEYQRIIDVVGKYAVHNSSIGFGLKKFNENNDIRTPPNSNAIDNIRTIYGNLIARELINFNVENDELKFKAHGYMTNVNYSTKKFTFLLFINNRLVDCTGLKKCIDQVYTTYLPKHMHPFVYLSLELDPRTIDVNVHPTKHEVHFLSEDQIIESLTSAIETKLLGSNNSRVFFVQTKLPGAVSDTKETGQIRTYDKDLVRTDAAEQKLDKFFVPSDLNRSENYETAFKRDNEHFLEKATDFENALNRSICLRSSLTKIQNECKLTSVLQLRHEIESQCHKTLRELFAQHVFVGCVNAKHSLVQHGTKLYLCDTTRIMEEVFYELVMYNFQNFGTINLSDPLPLKELARLALDLAETGWTEEDGNKDELAEKVQEILTEKGDMLKAYFSIDIDEFGYLKSLPLLLDNHLPEMGCLPMYILRLATEVDWEHEKKCFRQFARETGMYYAKMYESDAQSWKWVVEHVFYTAIKDFFSSAENVYRERRRVADRRLTAFVQGI
uniref:DNA mismatch repair protein S5 domain-containing protein n=1 Tax=Photinus pyralis TaxID=7054 RepID=A0A1Y1K4T7_PHOPY